MKRRLTRIEHLGSYACRNIYHRPDARRSEHASAEALDVSGFQLSDGRKITVLRGWGREETGPWLRAMLNASCHYYGNGLGLTITLLMLTIFILECGATACVVKA